MAFPKLKNRLSHESVFGVEINNQFTPKSNNINPIATSSINRPETLIIRINFLGVNFFNIIQKRIPTIPPIVFPIRSVTSLAPIAKIN